MIEQKNSLEEGYVWVPYTMSTNQIIDGSDPLEIWKKSKNIIRRRKINKIFNLGLDIKDDIFLPKNSIASRYSAVIISNPYNTISLKYGI